MLGDFADRTVNAIIRLRQRASGIESALVYIVFGGYRVAAGVDAGDKDGWIPFNESRQSDAGGAHVSDLKEPVRAERALDIQIPILRIRQMQVARDHEQRHGLGESLTERVRAYKTDRQMS